MADIANVGRTATLKKQLGLVSATSFIRGNIIGTRMKKSGGTYTYIREAFGDLGGFLFLWSEFIIGRPLSTTLAFLTAAQYILRPFFLTCPDMAPTTSKVMLGFVICGFVVTANTYSVKLGARLQTLTTVCKVTALLTIIVAGMVHIGQGHTEHFRDLFKSTNFKPSGVALAFYAGLFAFSGWSCVNTGVEEVCNPHRNIPLAIFGGLAVPTLGYLLANVAYHAVLTNDGILSGITVAYVHWLFPVIYVVFFLVLSVTAIAFGPRLYLTIFCVTLLGVPLYFLSRSRWWKRGNLARVNKWITLICYRLLLCEHASQNVV